MTRSMRNKRAAMRPALPSLLLLQRIHQIHRRVKAHAPAVPRDAGYANGRGQRRLAVPGPPTSTALCAASVNATTTRQGLLTRAGCST